MWILLTKNRTEILGKIRKDLNLDYRKVVILEHDRGSFTSDNLGNRGHNHILTG